MKKLVLAFCIGLLIIVFTAEKRSPFIPKNCMGKVTLTDFTKPCTAVAPDRARCDGVMIEFHCVAYRPANLMEPFSPAHDQNWFSPDPFPFRPKLRMLQAGTHDGCRADSYYFGGWGWENAGDEVDDCG